VIKHVINDSSGTAVAADFTLDSGGGRGGLHTRRRVVHPLIQTAAGTLLIRALSGNLFPPFHPYAQRAALQSADSTIPKLVLVP
jgi:hypothetical protein